MKDVLKTGALLLVLGVVQITLGDLWWGFGFVDLLMIAAGLLALRMRFAPAILTGAAAGLVQDSLGGGLIGLHAFAKTAVNAGLASVGQFLVVRGEAASALMIGAAAVLEGAIVVALLSFLSWPGGGSPLSLLVRGAVTGLACGLYLLLAPRVVMGIKNRRRRSGIRLP